MCHPNTVRWTGLLLCNGKIYRRFGNKRFITILTVFRLVNVVHIRFGATTRNSFAPTARFTVLVSFSTPFVCAYDAYKCPWVVVFSFIIIYVISRSAIHRSYIISHRKAHPNKLLIFGEFFFFCISFRFVRRSVACVYVHVHTTRNIAKDAH